METLDLTKLTKEQRERIMAIANSNINENISDIKQQYLSEIKNIKKSEEYETMDYDSKSSFNVELNRMSDGISERKRKGQLTNADKVTYRQLETIHESGSPANFWNKVKSVVESRKRIDISEVDDKIDINLI